MPFGLQLKSLIVGAIFAAVILPRIMAFIQSRNS